MLDRRVSSGLQNSEAATRAAKTKSRERRRAEEALRSAKFQTGYLGVRTGLYYRHRSRGTIVEFNAKRRRPSAFPYRSTGQRVAETIIPVPGEINTARDGPSSDLSGGAHFWQTDRDAAMRADGTEFPVELALSRIDVGAHRCLPPTSGMSPTEASRREIRLAVESAPNAMVMVNQNGKIVLVNSKLKSCFGYHRDELIGQPVEHAGAQQVRDAHPQYRVGFFAQPQARPMGVGGSYGLRKDGSEFPRGDRLNPIETDGRHLGSERDRRHYRTQAERGRA